MIHDMRPIIHLSFPVRDLDEAIAFYVTHLGAKPGRREESFADLQFFGAQLTLQSDPKNAGEKPRSTHFGVTLPWEDWKKLAYGFFGASFLVEGPRLEKLFTPLEQAKFMLRDPSGNLIEFKTYMNPEQVLGELATPRA
jgi:extradiol dioxygenase family protein